MAEYVMEPAKREEYEEYVLQSLREAGADRHLPNLLTSLETLDEDILEDATLQLRHDLNTSFKQNANMTINSLAEELWKADKFRSTAGLSHEHP